MPKKQPSPDLLMVRFEDLPKRDYYGDRSNVYAHVRCSVVRPSGYEKGEYSTPHVIGYGEPDCIWAHVTVDCQSDPSHLGRHDSDLTYGWGVEWSESDRTIEALERGVKALRPIRDRMLKMTEREGRPPTFGVFAMRAARAMGIERMVVYTPNSASGFKYTIDTLLQGADRIDYRARSWREMVLATQQTADVG